MVAALADLGPATGAATDLTLGLAMKAGVASLRASDLLRGRILQLPDPLNSLFPNGGPRRGSVLAIEGSTSVLLRIAAAALPARGWCAAVGFPALGLRAAAELGLDLRRFAVVRVPDDRWVSAVAALVDGIDILVLCLPPRCKAAELRRLVARAREREATLLATRWPENLVPADVRVSVAVDSWHGLGAGWGRLRQRQVTLISSGRGAASRQRQVSLCLPFAS